MQRAMHPLSSVSQALPAGCIRQSLGIRLSCQWPSNFVVAKIVKSLLFSFQSFDFLVEIGNDGLCLIENLVLAFGFRLGLFL